MEDQMTAVLKSLNFTAFQKPNANPTLDRRTRVIAHLEEQKLLLADAGYQRTVKTWKKSETGEKSLVETKQRVLRWWNVQPNGSYAFVIRSGWKPIEFEKGKAAIAVPSLDKLPAVIDTLITAVRNGELDEQLAQAAKQSRPAKAK
jgi:Family of unknown function (DUF6641)